MKIVHTMGYSDFFEEEPNEILDYLEGIGKTKLTETLIGLIPFSSKDSKFQDTNELISIFFKKENEDFAFEIYDKIARYKEEKGINSVSLITTENILYLLEICLESISNNESKNDNEIEIDLFKAILIQNEIIFKKQDISIKSVENVKKELKLASLSLTNTFANSDLHNHNFKEIIQSQVLKSVMFFEFLESTEKTKLLLDVFYSEFKVKSWKQYLIKLLPIIFQFNNLEIEQHSKIVIPKNNDYESNIEFLDKHSLGNEEKYTDFDFRKIRSNPILKVSEDTYLIIFRLFLIEMIHKGLYFHFLRINRSQKDSSIAEFRGFYCSEFSEKFLLYKLLNHIFKNRYIEYSGEEILNEGITGEPDYYVRNGNKIFLFENKDVLVPANIKVSYDYTIYEKDLKKKFLKDGKQKKAILQLINNIEKILIGEFTIDNRYKYHKAKIYPILVLHDHQYNIPGLNYIINNWFQEELVKLKEKNINISNIQPIVIIEINSLILHQDILRDKKIKFEEILNLYIKFFTDSTKPFNNLEIFSQFFNNYVDDKNIRRVPQHILDIGLKIFE